jgi:hypothetical protein
MNRSQIWSRMMVFVMVLVTVWSAAEGGHGPLMMGVAAVATIAAMMLFSILHVMAPQHRLVEALFGSVWILLFTPAWDWLSGTFAYPESITSALLFAGALSLVHFFISRRGSDRPPS